MKFFSIFALFFSFSLFASDLENQNWSGGYSGKLRMINELDQTFDCNEYFVVAHNIQKDWEGFWAYSGFPTCGVPSVLTASAIYEIKEGKVLYFGESLGDFNGTVFEIVKVGFGIKEELRIVRKSERELSYFKRVLFAGEESFFEISGTLLKN